MGDRTTVHLTVLTTQARAAKELFDYHSEEYEGVGITSFVFNEINYGELPFLPALREAGIAYDSCWDDGNEYHSGTASCRFSPTGEDIRKGIYDNARNPSLDALILLIDRPAELRQAILDQQEKIRVLPLDSDQEAYGKLYRTHALLGLAPASASQ